MAVASKTGRRRSSLTTKSKASEVNLSRTQPSIDLKWEVIVPLGPQAVYHVGVVIRGYLYIHGGRENIGSNMPSNQLYRLALGNSTMWEQIRTAGSPARSNHAAVVVDDRYLVLIGGWDGHKRVPEINIYDAQEDQWLYTKHSGFPEGAGLSSHTATLLASGEIIVVGREGSLRTQRRHGNAYILSGSILQKEFVYKEYSREVTSRSGHSANAVGRAIYIIGGRDDKLLERAGGFQSGASNNCLFLSSLLDKIEAKGQIFMEKLPGGRKNHISAANQRCILVHGGETFDGRSREPVGDMFLISIKSPTYFYQLVSSSPLKRAGHVCLVLDDRVLLHGGFSGKSCVHSDLCELIVASG